MIILTYLKFRERILLERKLDFAQLFSCFSLFFLIFIEPHCSSHPLLLYGKWWIYSQIESYLNSCSTNVKGLRLSFRVSRVNVRENRTKLDRLNIKYNAFSNYLNFSLKFILFLSDMKTTYLDFYKTRESKKRNQKQNKI